MLVISLRGGFLTAGLALRETIVRWSLVPACLGADVTYLTWFRAMAGWAH